MAACAFAPALGPTSSPSSRASRRAIFSAATSFTVTTSSTFARSKFPGSKPAPIPWIPCNPGSPPESTALADGSTATILTPATFDSRQMNWVAIGEFVLAVLTTQMDGFRRLLGTVEMNSQQFGWALLPAFLLLVLWEAGKWVARQRTKST